MQQFEPLGTCIKRSVIVLGQTGSGKSTVLNMLFNDDITREACTTPALVGSTSSSVTKETTYFINVKYGLALIDTIGFGDPNLSKNEIVHRTRTFLRNASIGINTVIVVAKCPRVTAEDRMNLRALQVLFGSRWKKSAVLLLTHYPAEFSESGQVEGTYLESWMKDDEEVQRIVRQFGKIILTENSTMRIKDETDYRPFRGRCLKDLKSFIAEHENTFMPAPVDFHQVVEDIVKLFAKIFSKSQQWLDDVAKQLKKDKIPTFAGECSICHEAIPIDSLVVTECSHIFHRDCIERWFTHSPSCPYCRKDEPVCYASLYPEAVLSALPEGPSSLLRQARVGQRRLRPLIASALQGLSG